ncbi:hypothetical protein BKA70DRAFT_1561878 [Coprinopsis sp. MPI-PUGE-AT-0042]|nr:hypothetical protein BKA70DRAFT_1561878 [Coprinopsis sp. MPI-PUGE-AT-0042]
MSLGGQFSTGLCYIFQTTRARGRFLDVRPTATAGFGGKAKGHTLRTISPSMSSNGFDSPSQSLSNHPS